jgi:hypothetical protein
MSIPLKEGLHTLYRMERTDVVILVNSTPAYYYILPLFFTMLRRYAPELKWPVYLATEEMEHEVCKEVKDVHGVKLLTLDRTESGFFESRLAALRVLKERYTYVFPLQDDFLLEMPMNGAAFKAVLEAMDQSPVIVSARCMPCPGPKIPGTCFKELPGWKPLVQKMDTLGFVFQATLWRTAACCEWYERISTVLERVCPKKTSTAAERKHVEISANIAENTIGQTEFWNWSAEKKYGHIAWDRLGSWKNAVYLSPFPYRPTAIVRGELEPWAKELMEREL